MRAEAAETAIASLRARSELGDEASAADVIDHVLRSLDGAQNHAIEPESPAEAPPAQAAAVKRADELAAQLAEQEKLRADAEDRAAQLAARLEVAEQELRAAAAAAAAREDAARAADAALHAELEDAQRQVCHSRRASSTLDSSRQQWSSTSYAALTLTQHLSHRPSPLIIPLHRLRTCDPSPRHH